MKTFIVKKQHLIEYVERKKAEKIFESIVLDIYNTSKQLNENISRIKANQDIINAYKKKNLISPRVEEMLIRHKIINEKHEII